MPNDLLSAALWYAELGWVIFPLWPMRDGRCTCSKPDCTSPGKHPRIKWSTGATCDPGAVRGLWTRWPNAGIGLACGPSNMLVSDLDGPTGRAAFEALGLGPVVTAVSRTARGAHVFFRGEGGTRSDPETKLDTRGVGGFVVLPPSPHASGIIYEWIVPPERGIAAAPEALVAYSRKGRSRGTPGAPRRQVVSSDARSGSETGQGIVPSYLVPSSGQNRDTGGLTARLSGALEAPDWPEVVAALTHIPPDCPMDEWLRVGMALHQSTNGSKQALDMWDSWSRFGGEKYKGRAELEYKWSTFRIRPDGVGLGSLFDLAIKRGYKRATIAAETTTDAPPEPQAADPTRHTEGMNGHPQDKFFEQFNEDTSNPLIRLNKEFAVIGNVGGKCLVLSWEDSPIDDKVKVPAFQSFKSFSERFANQYVTVKKTKHYKDGDEEVEEQAQLGVQWLKWTGRRTYHAMELQPNAPMELANGNYNLWRGWGVIPAAGRWDRMRDHIGEIMASGRTDHADYILRWGAWAVQNPGALAEAALVTRGDQGAGKGVFGRSLRRIFGGHGLQVFNSKHLVGNFNEHMRTCLFLFADEAHWAGDKQGAATLKGLITEPTRMLEGKGVNAVMWPNMVKLFMAANARWVVPAAHDERRYAVFDVAEHQKQKENYFRPLYAELDAGGLEAMLFDLLHMELGDWSPRRIPQTKALEHQKDLSMEPLMEWWYGLLCGDTQIRFDVMHGLEWSAQDLGAAYAAAMPRAPVSTRNLADFVRRMGATDRHSMVGTKWLFPTLTKARALFEERYGSREWRVSTNKWGIDQEDGT